MAKLMRQGFYYCQRVRQSGAYEYLKLFPITVSIRPAFTNAALFAGCGALARPAAGRPDIVRDSVALGGKVLAQGGGGGL
jgi:hypothetical protein